MGLGKLGSVLVSGCDCVEMVCREYFVLLAWSLLEYGLEET